jgi:hypothetical protein
MSKLDATLFIPKAGNTPRIVATLGRTDTGKTSFYNLMTGEKEGLGDHINSRTRICIAKETRDGHFRFIDTIGFKDTQQETESRSKIIDYFISFKDGLDIIFYVTRWQSFTSDEQNIFNDIFKTILTPKAFNNTCLLLTNCSIWISKGLISKEIFNDSNYSLVCAQILTMCLYSTKLMIVSSSSILHKMNMMYK